MIDKRRRNIQEGLRVHFVALSFLFVSFLFVSLLSINVRAEPVHLDIFDFDGTLVENRQVKDGAFNSKVFLFRNNQRLNLLQEQASGPRVIVATQQDLHKIVDYLGTGEGRPGAVSREVELLDGTRIRPGEYYLRYPDSYEHFREAPAGSGQNYLLEAILAAEKQSPDGKWQGPLWDLFSRLCETKSGAERVAILTARGHSRAEWDALLDHWIQTGKIKFKPSLDRIYNVSRPEFDRYGSHGESSAGDSTDISTRKSRLIEEIIMSLGRVDPGPGQRHSIMASDDEAKNLNGIAAVYKKIAFSSRIPVDMILVNAGLESEIRKSGRFEFAMIEPEGSFRSLSRSALFERRGLSPILRTCESFFIGSGK